MPFEIRFSSPDSSPPIKEHVALAEMPPEIEAALEEHFVEVGGSLTKGLAMALEAIKAKAINSRRAGKLKLLSAGHESACVAVVAPLEAEYNAKAKELIEALKSASDSVSITVDGQPVGEPESTAVATETTEAGEPVPRTFQIEIDDSDSKWTTWFNSLIDEGNPQFDSSTGKPRITAKLTDVQVETYVKKFKANNEGYDDLTFTVVE